MLGVLRCDWSEVASLIGVAVTPVVGFLGNLSQEQIHPNPEEVRESERSHQSRGQRLWFLFLFSNRQYCREQRVRVSVRRTFVPVWHADGRCSLQTLYIVRLSRESIPGVLQNGAAVVLRGGYTARDFDGENAA